MKKSNRCVYAFGLFLTMAFASAGTALAADSSASLQDENIKLREEIPALKAALGQDPIACSSIDLRTAPLHLKCTTSVGKVFERVARDNFHEAWKGPDGLIWSGTIGADTQYGAFARCAQLGAALPSTEDFDRGKMNGFYEVLPSMDYKTKLLFWTTGEVKYDDNLSYAYDTSYGSPSSDDRSRVNLFRCVAR